MNTAIFWRLIWKEYRQQRALWTAIALAGLIFQVAVLVVCSLNGVEDLPGRLFTVALSLPVLYSLGCGAALFAGEHEAETFPFQQSLPVSAGRVFFAKFAFAVISALLLFPVLWLLALAMANGQLPDAEWHWQLWGGGVVATIEVLIWAVLGSLILRRVLPAAVVSGATAVLLGYGSLVLMVAFGGLREHPASEYFGTVPLRSCCALFALAVAVKLGRQWFSECPIPWTSTAPRRSRLKAATQRPVIPSSGFLVLTRLVWHEWRQARTTLSWCVLGYVAVASWLAGWPTVLMNGHASQLGAQAYLGLLPILATIFGASAFTADQRQGQYQFFTEHGVRPRLVWLSRQLVWGLALMVLAAFAVSLQAFERRLPFDQVRTMSLVSIGFALLMFASGQVCSILVRSGIVAVFTAAMCSVLLFSWSAFMGSLGVPWLLSSLPLPFIFFWASWFYAPKWIQQRQTWRVRTATAVTIVVPLLVVVAATAAYRVYEIPAIELSFDPAVSPPDDSPAARETAAMYREADQILRRRLTWNSSDDSTGISSRDDEWQKGIELFIAASRRETCHFYHWNDAEPRQLFDGQQLTRTVLVEAKARVEAGDLEGAAELHDSLLRLASHFYQQHFESWCRGYGMAVEQELYPTLPMWADHESLTHERLQRALTQFRLWSQSNAPDWEANVIEQRSNARHFIALDDRIMKNYYQMGKGERAAIRTLGTLLPWERWRMSRLLDLYTEAELQGLREVRARGPRIPPYSQTSLPWDVRLTLSNGKVELMRSTDVEALLITTRWLQMNYPLAAPAYVSFDQRLEVRRNAMQLQLAVIAWRKQHDTLPDSLDELPGDTFESLPLDPYTNQPFVYFPDGVEEEVWENNSMGTGGMEMTDGMGSMSAAGMAPVKPRLVRSEPFLWSPGEELRFVPGMRRGPSDLPIASDFRDQHGNPLSESNLLHLGLRYPIPQPKQEPSDSPDDADASPNDK